jgi:hypothetical protein
MKDGHEATKTGSLVDRQRINDNGGGSQRRK